MAVDKDISFEALNQFYEGRRRAQAEVQRKERIRELGRQDTQELKITPVLLVQFSSGIVPQQLETYLRKNDLVLLPVDISEGVYKVRHMLGAGVEESSVAEIRPYTSLCLRLTQNTKVDYEEGVLYCNRVASDAGAGQKESNSGGLVSKLFGRRKEAGKTERDISVSSDDLMVNFPNSDSSRTGLMLDISNFCYPAVADLDSNVVVFRRVDRLPDGIKLEIAGNGCKVYDTASLEQRIPYTNLVQQGQQ